MFNRLRTRAGCNALPGRPRLRREREPNRRSGFAVVLILGIAAMPVARAAEAEASATDARLDQLFGEHAAFHAFLDELKVAVAADDRPKVAGLVSYPLRTRIEGHAVRLRTPEDFLAHYDALI